MSDYHMSDYLIPDLFRIVLEYSNYKDRECWDFPEDTGLVYDIVLANVELYYKSNRSIKKLTKIKNVMAIYNNELPNLLSLELYRFNVHLNLSGFPNLASLDVGIYFNHPLDLSGVPNLTSLILGGDFNQPLSLRSVPKLKYLNLGVRFNQPLSLCGAPNLTSLTLSSMYNKPLDLSGVPNLISLMFGSYFNQPLSLRYVPNLTFLCLGYSFNQTLDLSIVPNLKIFDLQSLYDPKIIVSPEYKFTMHRPELLVIV